MWPIKTYLFFVGFAAACALSLAYPIAGIVNYMLVYQVNPSKMWWARPLETWEIRYSFTAAVCLILGMVINSARLPRIRGPFGYWECLVLVFTCIVLVSLLQESAASDYSATLAEKMVKMAVFLLCLGRLASTRKHFRVVLWTLVIGTLMLGNDAYHAPEDDFYSGRLNTVGGPDFRDSSGLAAHMSAMLPLIGAAFLTSSRWRWRLTAMMSGALAVNTIVQCRTRSAVVGLAAGLVAAVMTVPKGRRVRIYSMLVFAMLGAWALTDDGFWHRMESLMRPDHYRTDQTIQSRFQLWAVARNMFYDHPLGVGVGRFRDTVGDYNDGTNGFAFDLPRRVTHNSYLLCVTELGIHGTAIFATLMAFSIYALYRCSQLAGRSDDPLEAHMLTYGCLLSVIVYLVAAAFTDRLYTESFWWVLALPVCLHRALRREAATGLEPALAREAGDVLDAPTSGSETPPPQDRAGFRSCVPASDRRFLKRMFGPAWSRWSPARTGPADRPTTAPPSPAGRDRKPTAAPGSTAFESTAFSAARSAVCPIDDPLKGPPPLPAHAELTATSTGLLLFDFEVGVGRSPDGASKVTVDYAGYLQDGTLFGYGHAVQLDLSELVEGLADGIRTMLEAGRRRIIIPSKPPGNETTATTDAGAIAESMIFDVTLLTVE